MELDRLTDTLIKITQTDIFQKEEYQVFKMRAQMLLNELTEKEYRISIVGEFSSGKSTFLNALLGIDILPHSVNETTAAITYIKNVNKDHEYFNKVIIEYTNTTEKVVIDMPDNPQDLMTYVTTMSKSVDVVKEINSVTLHIDFPSTDEPIVFVDTPGLNGVAEGHVELTVREIQKAHTSIFLLSPRGISQSNLEIYELIKKYQSSFIFIINAIDTLKADEGETVDNKIDEIKKQLLKIGISEGNSVLGVSSLNALISRDKQLAKKYRDKGYDIDSDHLWESSNFENVENEIWNKLVITEKEKLKFERVLMKFEALKEDILFTFESNLKISKASIDTTQLQGIEKRIEYAKENKLHFEKTLDNYITARKLDVRSMLFNKMENDVTKLKEYYEEELSRKFNEMLNSQDDIKKLLNDYEKEFTYDVYEKEMELLNKYETSMSIMLNDIYEGAVLKINKNYPNINIINNKVTFKLSLDKENVPELLLQDEIEQLELEMKWEKKFADISEQKLYKSSISLSRDEKEVKSIKDDRKNFQQQHMKRIKQLGKKPDIKIIEEKVHEKKNIIGRTLDFFTGGSGYNYYSKKIEDTSDRDRWIAEYNQRQKEYAKEMKKFNEELDFAKKKLSETLAQHTDNLQRAELINKKIKDLQNTYEVRLFEQKEIFDKSKRVFFNAQKSKLNETLSYHLDNDYLRAYKKEIRSLLDREVKNIFILINKENKLIYNQYIKHLSELKSKILNSEKTHSTKETEDTIKELKIILG
ncbi:dynamin family protein [Macrococcoides canis]|uniref:dynamin family protein n=1 Tax=Macrococcoides canis TaxID=1855823 RepID=UPI00165D4AF0|nr:dynamin family protein [Macrococcus canis]QNR07161.1 hypothetical protein GL258_02485 [Macrococcus canis]